MSSMDGGKFATINEEDTDWGYDGQRGSSSQDAWNVNSVARGQERCSVEHGARSQLDTVG